MFLLSTSQWVIAHVYAEITVLLEVVSSQESLNICFTHLFGFYLFCVTQSYSTIDYSGRVNFGSYSLTSLHYSEFPPKKRKLCPCGKSWSHNYSITLPLIKHQVCWLLHTVWKTSVRLYTHLSHYEVSSRKNQCLIGDFFFWLVKHRMKCDRYRSRISQLEKEIINYLKDKKIRKFLRIFFT